MARPRKAPPKEYPLMPRATAVWLVENTSLTFHQISDFCGLHPLEVQGIADGEVAIGVRGADPIANHQLIREEIERAEGDKEHALQLAERRVSAPNRKTRGPRYTPISKRQDKPDAIVWLLRSHPDLKDAQISRLIGTTKNTIQAIRDRRHWNSANLRPRDPILMELCTSEDLSHEVERARQARERAERRAAKEAKKNVASASADTVSAESLSSESLASESLSVETLSAESLSAENLSAENMSAENLAENVFTPDMTASQSTQEATGQEAQSGLQEKSQEESQEKAQKKPQEKEKEPAGQDDSPFAALRDFKIES